MKSEMLNKWSPQKILHPNLYTYATYAQLYKNTNPSLGYLQTELSKFDFLATALILSRLNLLMTIDNYAADSSFQYRLARNFLNAYTLDKYDQLLKLKQGGSFIFHRHQLLFLLKNSFMLCSQNPDTNFEIPDLRHKFGSCCLLANDFLYLTKVSEGALDQATDDFKKEVLWKEFLPSYELYIPAELAHSIARIRIIFKKILPNMPQSSGILGLESYFRDFTKLSIDDYTYMIFAVLALYIQRRKDLLSVAPAIFIEQDNFTTNTIISPKNIDQLFKLISIPIEEYKDEITNSRDRDLTYGFLAFKKYPIAKLINNKYICLDFNFLLDKITNGIFWIINDNLNKKDRDNFHTYWGKIFESYVKTFIEYALGSNKDIFVPNPQYENEEGEVSDGILFFEEDLILLEYKFTVLTQEAKYTESFDSLLNQIKIKYEKNQKNEWKGYGQLANSINRIFKQGSNVSCKYIKKEKIKRIFPILITYEHFLNSPLTNYFFNKLFQQLIDIATLTRGLEIKPLILISIQDFEASQPLLKTMNKLILERIEYDPNLYFSYSDFIKYKYRIDPSLTSDWIDIEYRSYFEEIKKAIFG